MDEHRYCKQPDRDAGELICGVPLPCPWHTVTIDTRSVPPTITIPATNQKALRPAVRSVLKEIALSIQPESVRKVKRSESRRRGEGQSK